MSMERVRVMCKHCYILHKTLEMHRFCHLKGVIEPVQPRAPKRCLTLHPEVCVCVSVCAGVYVSYRF